MNNYKSQTGEVDKEGAGARAAASDPRNVPACAACLTDQKNLLHKKIREATIHGEQDERERIAHELHDNVNQILTSAQLYLACLERGSEDFDMMKAKATEILAMAIDEVRTLAHNIIPPRLKEMGLIECI